MEKRLSTVEFYQLKIIVMTALMKKYGTFPLADTKHRREQEKMQANLFTHRAAPRKWRKGKNAII